MIYLFAALYPEAKSVIKQFQLKKQQVPYGFQVYENDSIRLILTGQGAWAAASVAGSCLAFYGAGKDDFCINWGSCGGEEAIGSVYRCHKIVDGRTDFAYYPDMVYSSALPEAAVITEPQIWKSEEKSQAVWGRSKGRAALHDMEAAAIYFAASYFLSPHQMLFFKAVTDSGSERLSSELLGQRMEQAAHLFIRELCVLVELQEEEQKQKIQAKIGQIRDYEELWAEFHCSQTMKTAFLQCIRYWDLEGVDFQAELRKMRNAGLLPCKNKMEGKKRFEQLKAKLL